MTRLGTLGLTAAAILTAAFAGNLSSFAQMDHGTMGMEAMQGASKAYMDAMGKMDDEMSAMKATGKPGVDFALMMIPHHQSAIDMAKAYLASGEANAELTKLSNDIIAAQESEIAFLKGWLAKNGQ